MCARLFHLTVIKFSLILSRLHTSRLRCRGEFLGNKGMNGKYMEGEVADSLKNRHSSTLTCCHWCYLTRASSTIWGNELNVNTVCVVGQYQSVCFSHIYTCVRNTIGRKSLYDFHLFLCSLTLIYSPNRAASFASQALDSSLLPTNSLVRAGSRYLVPKAMDSWSQV